MKLRAIQVVFLLHATFAPAQPLAGPAASAPPVAPAVTGKAVGLTPEIEDFLKKLAATYKNAASYRDQGRVTLVQQVGRVKTTTEMPMELACQRPNRLRLDAGQYTVASDGKDFFFVVPGLNQYTAGRSPEDFESQRLPAGTILGGVDEGHPELTDFLFRQDARAQLLKQVARIGWMSNTVVAGISCRVLAYRTVQGTKIAVSVDTNRMVILKVRAETAAASSQSAFPPAAAPGAAPGSVTTLNYELSPVELNPKLDAALFAYKPAPGLKRVAEIGAGDTGDTDQPRADNATTPEGSHLLGKPLPEFTGHDLAGKPLAAADLQGKTVLLFFWSLTGGEYCLVAIPIVQQIADHFQKRSDVLVLGVTGDTDQAEVAAQMLKRKEARFRNMLDEDRQFQTRLQLGGLPTFIVVGPDGLVKWASLGAPPSLKEDLIREVENALPPSAK